MDIVVLESAAFNELVAKLGERLETAINVKIADIVKQIEENKKVDAVKLIQDLYLDPKEACQALKCSMRTLHSYKEKGLLKYIKKEGKLWFKISDIHDFLESAQVNTPKNHLPSIL